MTLCELVTMRPAMSTSFASFFGSGSRSYKDATFLFLDWLSSLHTSPTPRAVREADADLASLVSEWLCVPDASSRKTCAQALSHPWFLAQALSYSVPIARLEFPPAGMARRVRPRARIADVSSMEPLYQGSLWKLSSGADPWEAKNWLQRDMWITQEGSLCYFSQRQDKRLVLIDAFTLHNAELLGCEAARPFSFLLDFTKEMDFCDREVLYFAANDEAQLKDWTKWLRYVAGFGHDETFRLGQEMEGQIEAFRMHLVNRRLEVRAEGGDDHGFQASMTAHLWKLKVRGDCTTEDDWFKRKFSMSNNGSLIYYSEREQKELIYYTCTDVSSAALAKLGYADIGKPFGFSVTMPSRQGVEFDPGMFAAESQDMREKWLVEFKRHGATISVDKSAVLMRRKSIC